MATDSHATMAAEIADLRYAVLELKAENDRLRAVNAELVAACKEALPAIVGCSVYDCRGTDKMGCWTCATRKQIQEALARAERR